MVARCVLLLQFVYTIALTHTRAPCAPHTTRTATTNQPAVLRFFDQGANETRVNDGAVQHMTHEGDTTQTRNSPL